MAEDTEETRPTILLPPAQVDAIKRTTAPETKNGSLWQVQLSAVPSREWLEFFKSFGKASGAVASQLVVFDRASATFKSDEDHVEQWIESLDKWIASADARYRLSVDEASRERSIRLDAEAKQRERIQQMNDRFKNL
jgi:hypothetical protein